MIEQNEGLQNLFLDDEIPVLLRRRDWIVLAIIWAGNGGDANYKKALGDLQGMDIIEPSFVPCMRSPHAPHSGCKQERVQIEKTLLPMIGLKD